MAILIWMTIFLLVGVFIEASTALFVLALAVVIGFCVALFGGE